ncbi:MAG: TetR/AcrR family transcriptional regulator [Actinobacteria bacterium]|nr:TetR/AcrR family transcriptional regulator [Actinomycetota bacterium]
MNAPIPTDGAVTADGRRLRRDRNRDAVVQALLSLYNDGNLDPSTEEIAARSGVSARSLFRYFDDVDDLCSAAIAQQQENVRHLLPLSATPDEPLAVRIAALVRQRGELFEAIESAAMVSRLRAPFQLVVADRLTEGRSFLRQQIGTLFARELGQMPEQVAAARLAAADVIASFESWRLLRDDQRLSIAAASNAISESLTTLFTIPIDEGPINEGPSHEGPSQEGAR